MIARAVSLPPDALTAAAFEALEANLLGRFQIEGPLGGLAESRVYAAIETSSGTPVAIKFGRPRRTAEGRVESDEEARAALRHEAEVLRALDGVGAPRLREFHEQPPCLVLDRIDGVNLERYSHARRFAPADIAEFCGRLAEAVMAIHARGYLHGDIKPSNIVVGEDGGPVLVDFGASRRLIAADDAAERSATPGYAAPEFHRADRPIGPWSDVYSLGAVAYRMATGRAPVPAEARLGGTAMASAVDAAGAAIPGEFAAAIDWALEIEPAARPFCAEEWRQALRRTGDDRTGDPGTVKIRRRLGPDSAAPGRSQDKARPRRRRALVMIGAAVAAVLVAVPLLGPELVRLYQSRFKQEWLVDAAGHGDVPTISAALARAPDGATIRVRPGHYAESLSITRPVALIGLRENGEEPVVVAAKGPCIASTAASAHVSHMVLRAENGPDRDVPCVELAAGRIEIEGARVSGPGIAVAARSGAELRLVDTAVSGSVLVSGGARTTISGGEVRDSDRSGIVVRGGSDISLSGTQVRGSRAAGLLLAEGATARIEKATIGESGTSAIEIASGASLAIADSTIAGASQAGIYVLDGGKAVVERTQVAGSGLSGLIAAATADVKIDGSTFEQNREHGVLALDAATMHITNSRMVGNAGFGIAVERGATAELTDNVAERNREPQILDARRPEAGGDRKRGGAS